MFVSMKINSSIASFFLSRNIRRTSSGANADALRNHRLRAERLEIAIKKKKKNANSILLSQFTLEQTAEIRKKTANKVQGQITVSSEDNLQTSKRVA